MKKFVFSCAIAISGLLIPAVSAQDYCCPVQYDPCCCEPGFDGLYLGGNLGVFTHVGHRNDLDGFLTDNGGWTSSSTDFTAGVQLGYDIQCNSSVFGLVVDWNWVNTDRRIRDNPNTVGTDNFIHNEVNWFTTIRARAGITVCDALLYVTGGAAVTRFDTRWRSAPDEFRHNRSRWGWTGGVGAEFKVWCNWTLGAEFLVLHFDNHDRSFTTAAGVPFSFGHSDTTWIGRILLNYRFGDLCSLCN